MTHPATTEEALARAGAGIFHEALARESDGAARSPRRRARRDYAAAVSVAAVAVLIAVWWIAADLKLVSPVFLPGPADVLRQAVALASKGYMDSTLFEHVAASLTRVLLALAGTVLVGVPIGVAMGLTTIGRGIFDPLIEFIRPIPPLAYLPLVIIWLGIGEPSKVLVIAIAMLAPITIATASGVRAVPAERLNAARSMGATRIQLVRHVILPSALPSILTGLRIALGAGWSTLVAAELVAATRGLGFMIQSASAFLVTDVVIAGIVIIAAIAFALEIGIRLAERAFVPWTGKS